MSALFLVVFGVAIYTHFAFPELEEWAREKVRDYTRPRGAEVARGYA